MFQKSLSQYIRSRFVLDTESQSGAQFSEIFGISTDHLDGGGRSMSFSDARSPSSFTTDNVVIWLAV